MYHSWWFTILLALLVLNLTICSLKRLPRTIRLARPVNVEKVSSNFLKKQTFSHSEHRRTSIDELLPEMRKAMVDGFARPKETRTDWGALLWADKWAFSRFGAYLIHGSILLIVAGAIIGGALGFEANLELTEGETAGAVRGRRPTGRISLPFSIRLDRFVVKFYASGAPSEYRSEVTVLEGGREVHRADIRVNHPLTWRGVTFYQSSHGQTLSGTLGLRLTRGADDKPFDLKIDPDRPQPLPEGGGTIQVLEFAKNLMNAGPAVRLLIRPAQGQAYTAWAFKDRSSFVPQQKVPWAAIMTSFQLIRWTGLQVNRDPGVLLIWIGCVLMLAGFVVTFFFSHQKLYLGLIPEENRTRFILAGSSHRSQGSFQIKFERLAARVTGQDSEEAVS